MTSAMTKLVARLLILPVFVVAAAFLVRGYVNVGDGFSAGVMVGSGLALQYLVFGWKDVEKRLPGLRFAPLMTFAGLLLVLSLVFVPVLLGDPLLTHYPRSGEPVVHLGTVEFLTPMLFDVGVFLLVTGFVVTIVMMLSRTAERSDA